MEKVIPDSKLKFSLQRIISIVYFFFNSVGLKGGLLYTNILSPWFFIQIIRKGYFAPLLYTIAIILPYAVIHYSMGVNLKSMLISTLLLFSTVITVVAAWDYINHYESVKATLHSILQLNFILALIAIPFYFLDPPYQSIFWYKNLFTTQKTFVRLSLMTFEASYYALLMVPLVYYFLFRLSFENQDKNKTVILFMIFIPFLLTLSFGVLGTTALVALFMLWFNRKHLNRYRKFMNVTGIVFFLTLMAITITLIFFSNSLPVQRVINIFTGYDTSTRGRTFEAFEIAWKVAAQKSVWFGCGLGQTKFLLPDIIHTYFSHWGKQVVYRIPNAMAETLAIFGITGVVIKIFLQLYFFFKTRVNKNYLRLSLFLFVFIYQFTGSFLTNIVEYVIWIFAFSTVFTEFDTNHILKPKND